MQNDAEKKPVEQAYCFNCGASNATHPAIVTVGYRYGGGNSYVKEGRPHCQDCAAVENSVSNIFYIIFLAVAAIFLAGYVLSELF